MIDELKNMFNINETSEMEFYEKYGFTFVFERKIIHINDKLTSAEIIPHGIIYLENNEYYLAPLDNDIDINTIIKEYVKKTLLR